MSINSSSRNADSIPWKRFAFNGVSFDVPPTWDLAELAEDNAGAYRFRFEEEGETRLMGRSARASGKADLAKPLGQALVKIGKELNRRRTTDFNPGEIRRVNFGGEGQTYEVMMADWNGEDLFGHILTFRDSQRAVNHLLSFHWLPGVTPGEVKELMTRFGKSFRVGENEHGMIDWRIGGLKIELEPDWRIEHFKTAVCETILNFRHARWKSRQLVVGRWGMAGLRLSTFQLDLWALRLFKRKKYFHRIDSDPVDRVSAITAVDELRIDGYPDTFAQRIVKAVRRIVQPRSGAYISGRIRHDRKENAVLMLAFQDHVSHSDDDVETLMRRLELDVMHPRPAPPKVRKVKLEVDAKGKPIITPAIQLASVPTPNPVVDLKQEGETIWYLEAPANAGWKLKTLRVLSGQSNDSMPPLRLMLDEAGLFVWKRIDGKTRVDQLIHEFSQHFRISFLEAQRALWEFLKSLVKRNLCAIVIPDVKS